MTRSPVLWPTPKSGGWLAENVVIPRLLRVEIASSADLDAILRRFESRAGGVGVDLEFSAGATKEAALQIRIDPDTIHEREGYRLRVQRRLEIVAHDVEGVRHALTTFCQWLSAAKRTPRGFEGHGLLVDDAPDFAVRGVMLDVSRSRVPRRETLHELVDRLESYKVNQLQLYMEHVFAYRGHETVWHDSSPFTAEEIRALDAYCSERGIELVPNQQSFGHMHRWLKHAAYRDLAEVPEGVEHAFSLDREPYSLDLGNPKSLALLDDLYGQLLPNFTSAMFNVGLDETFDLGQGRSKAACAERGVERVYLEYLAKIHALVKSHGKRMQFWGDVVLQRPELVPELPKDLIALEWGYDAAHPFAEHVEHFARSGLEFYVCPGTSSWQSFGGRTDNMLANVKSAAIHGRKAGARGYLVTDWGDRGHHQPHFVKEAGLLAGAGLAWNVDAHAELDESRLGQLLSRHVFAEEGGFAGQAVVNLGNASGLSGSPATNGSALFFLIAFALTDFPHARTPGLDSERLLLTANCLGLPATVIGAARMRRDDADWIVDEVRWCAEAMKLGADLGIARLAAGAGVPLEGLPSSVRAELSERFAHVMRGHERIWLRRDRPGGLSESQFWFERVRQKLAAR